MSKINKEQVLRIIVIAYVLLYIFIGMFIEKDYGWSIDDDAQRTHSLVAYKYVNEVLFGKDLSNREPFTDLPDIHDYRFKYYGVALQLPFVFIEHLNGFKLSIDQIYHIKHKGSALICTMGYLFFYLFVKGITKRRDLGFLALLMLSLYPRFFGEKFVNIKDQVFVATCCMAYFGLYLYLEKNRDIRYGIFAGFTAAVATFSRNVGIMFPIMLVAYMLVTDIVYGRIRVVFRCIRDYAIIVFSYLLFWYIGTPVAWFRNPFKEFVYSFKFFSVYEIYGGDTLFNGRILTWKEFPWYHVFAWMGITVPLLYIVLFVVGHFCIIKKDESHKSWFYRMLNEDKYLSLALCMYYGPCLLVAIHKIKIYDSWRHLYFILCPFIVIAVYGWVWIEKRLINRTFIRKIAVGVVGLSIVMQIFWIVKNHPYQYVYFNPIGRTMADRFDRDYFSVCKYDLLKWILANEDRKDITIGFPDTDISMFLIPWDERSQVKTSWEEEGDYIVYTYLFRTGNEYDIDGYSEVYHINVDGFKIGSVYKKEEG